MSIIQRKFNNAMFLFYERVEMVKIVIDYSKCLGDADKICVEICPVLVFKNENSKKPKVVNEENCILCRTCQVNCPGQAIKILV